MSVTCTVSGPMSLMHTASHSSRLQHLTAVSSQQAPHKGSRTQGQVQTNTSLISLPSIGCTLQGIRCTSIRVWARWALHITRFLCIYSRQRTQKIVFAAPMFEHRSFTDRQNYFKLPQQDWLFKQGQLPQQDWLLMQGQLPQQDWLLM